MTNQTTRAVDLPATRAAPRLGREFARAALTDWGLGSLIDTATLLVSEVVTNAVVHARSASVLSLAQVPGAIHVSVIDQGEGNAHRATRNNAIAGGHGLALVDTLSRQWGSRRVDAGHEVWFDLAIPAVGTPAIPDRDAEANR